MTSSTVNKSTKSRKLLANTFMGAVMIMVMAMPAQAATPRVSDILNNNGFTTLLLVLDLTGLTSVLDANRVTLFAPTNDVFDETALALGCSDAVDLAERLFAIPVGDSNALAVVLSYHAYLGRFKNDYKLLEAGVLQMVSGDNVTTGVGAMGLNVKGIENDTPSNITTAAIKAKKKSSVYAIDQILLPISAEGVCTPA